MSNTGKLTIIAISAITIIGVGVSAFAPPRPAPEYTAASPYPEESWEFIVYEEDGSVSSLGYNLTLDECLIMSETTQARSKACERQR